ncbi:hypothetical protein IV102_16425 [bacterium]|nr:hypothetical protein [bacterium]
MASRSTYALWLAAAVGLLNAARLLVGYYGSGHLLEGHTAGVWAALAYDFTQGEFYRPVLDERGYGGTRYMPAFFAVHAGVAQLTGEFVLSGWVWLQLGVCLCLGAVYSLLRQQGLPRSRALPIALLLLGTSTYQRLSVQLRCDFLAAAGVFWCVLWVEKYLSGRRRGWLGLAVASLAAAFFTKFSSIYGLLWVAFRLAKARCYAEAGAAVAAIIGLCGVGWWILEKTTSGRFGQNMGATANTGSTFKSLIGATETLFVNLCYEDPMALMLFLATIPFALILGLCWRPAQLRLQWQAEGASPAEFNFTLHRPYRMEGALSLVTWAVTLAIFTSPGTWLNHLVDPIMACLLVMGLLFQAPQTVGWAGCSCALIAALHMITWVPGAPSVQATLTGTGAITFQSLESLRRRFDFHPPYLAENPSVPLALGHRPVLLDEFTLRVFLRNRHPVGLDFIERVRNRAFSLVVLEYESRWPAPLANEPEEFWNRQPPEFRFIRDYYQVAAVSPPLAVLLPKR